MHQQLKPPAEQIEEPNNLPAVLRDAFATGEVVDGNGARMPLSSNVSLDEAATLYRVVSAIKPSVSAEVGFAQGISTLAILKALADNELGIHHVVDPFQADYGDSGLAMVARAGLEARLQFYRKFGEEVIPHLPPLQFAFIDGSHLFDLTLVEFVLMDKKLEVGGLLSLHDMWMPSLQKLVRYILSNRDYAIVRTFDAGKAPSPPSVKQRVKLALATAFRCVPGKAWLFQEELLRPWRALQLPNMVVLRKQADDKRDWRFHQPF